MKYLLALLLAITLHNAGTAQTWQVGVRTGIDKTYYPDAVIKYSEPSVLSTELFGRRERKKWTADIGISFSQKFNSGTFHGSLSDLSTIIKTNQYELTASYQRKILNRLSKKDKIKNYVGPFASFGYQYNKQKTTTTLAYDGTSNEYLGYSYNYNTTVGLAYYLSISVTNKISIVTNIRTGVILLADNGYGINLSDIRVSGLLGVGYKL